MKTNVYYLFLCFILYANNAYAQNTNYQRKYLQAWEESPIKNEQVADEFAAEDAVILYEKSAWNIKAFINKGERTSMFKKNMRIKFLTEKGIQQYANITIPEPCNPQYEYSDLPKKEHENIYRPKYFELNIRYLKARLIKADGKVNHVQPQDEIISEKMLYNARDRTAYAYHFSFPKIDVGDVLEIEYLYFVPFVFDWKRIFFHGDMPKQESVLEITYPGSELMFVTEANGLALSDSTKNKKRPFNITKTWKQSNLKACINEPGGRPYLELPYLEYYFHNKAYGVFENDAIVEFSPYSWTYYGFHLLGFRELNMALFTDKLSRKEAGLNLFYDEQVKDIKEENHIVKLNKMNAHIAENFDYVMLKDHYFNTDKRLSHLHSYYREKLLKEINRYTMYEGIFNRLSDDLFMEVTANKIGRTSLAKMERVPNSINKKRLLNINKHTIYEGIFNRLEEDYFMVFISDNRLSKIDPRKCLPVLGRNTLYSTSKENKMFYVFPKNQREGHYINELPFYLENTFSLHVLQMIKSTEDLHNTRLYKTPNSSADDNYRLSNVKATVSLAEKKISFDAKIILSGQFSTLTRGVYKHSSIDSTINERYDHKIMQLNKHATHNEPKIKVSQIYPFKTDIRVDYTAPNIVTKKDEKTYTIDLKQWFRHIIYEKFEAKNREMAFYSDFIGRDTYRYYVEFDKPISVKAFKDLPLEIENEMGNYKFDIQQMSPTSLMIQSDLWVAKPKVEAEKTADVEQIFKTIEQVEKATLEVVLDEK
ncbi:MAG: DUF3857 domain-containing protein [Chitinophagales bacterium]